MYCPKCGTQNDDNAFRCIKCGIVIQQVPSGKKKNTAVIVLVVAGIVIGLFILIGILAAIAIPPLVNQQTKARNAVAQVEVRNACQSAAEFFLEHPGKTMTLDDLKEQGFAKNPDIELSIENGTMKNLSIHAKHSKGNKVYVADKNCDVQEIKP